MLDAFLALPFYLQVEHTFVCVFVLWFLMQLRRYGVSGMLSALVARASKLPGVAGVVSGEIEKEASKAVADMFQENEASRSVPKLRELPAKGMPRARVLETLKKLSTLDSNADEGNLFAYVYAFGDEHSDGEQAEQRVVSGKAAKQLTHYDMLDRAFTMFLHKNALNPVAFPALKRFENEVVAMALDLLNAPSEGRGTMTSGGTESILMAVKAYRELARSERGVTQPNIVLCRTAHPAFEKACHYFDVKSVYVEPLANFRADVRGMERAIDSNTIAIVGSAPQYPHGIVDPIEELAHVALSHNVPMHVDACVGGYLLPWVEKLGFDMPVFDFRNPGVMSMSADLHKYGFAAKGASTILWRNESYRRHQFFSYGGWPGGLFVSPSALGTRGGGPIAAAWAAMVSMGKDGYLETARGLMETSVAVQEGINSVDGLHVIGKPHATIVSFTSDSLNIFAIADYMENHFGWTMERQQLPDSIHLSLMPVHAKTKDKLIADLRASVEHVRSHPELESQGTAAMYGMVAKIPSASLVEDFLNAFMLKVYSS